MGTVLIIVVLAILLVSLIGMTVGTIMHMSDEGGILNEDVLEDYLNTLSDKYTVYRSEYTTMIDPLHSANVKKRIEVSYSAAKFIFPYYIPGVGVIPAWSRSKKRIDAMFETSSKEDWKRKELGLR
jgi:hypothetical protein